MCCREKIGNIQFFFKVVEWANYHVVPNSVQRLQEERKRVESRIFLEVMLSNWKNYQHIKFRYLIAVSEAEVEWAFSKHKLIHSQLQACISENQLDSQLFIWYNFPNAHENVEENKLVTFTFEPLWYIVTYVDNK